MAAGRLVRLMAKARGAFVRQQLSLIRLSQPQRQALRGQPRARFLIEPGHEPAKHRLETKIVRTPQMRGGVFQLPAQGLEVRVHARASGNT